ncbi:TRAP transporter permease [Thermasporomyces composti]|jgi:TRAP transporter 4TM/12TM fusion protein|uniref:TRAP transporter 4TM/12TM fusion protein n=1 Tax=Thermasporomyces composti TaxID=696763 RepID=A0A3D9V7W2_THECX|nr:TRAP transporter fused permease subunit [Thermasporomyces composti]REF36240.1 TRAP transporter 4TM/12TM fusion protein [Thermasporomyces composti]
MPQDDHPKSAQVDAIGPQNLTAPGDHAPEARQHGTTKADEGASSELTADRVPGEPETAGRRPEEILAAHDEERPARRLSGPVDVGVTVACALLSVFVLWVVFAPLAKGTQYYLTLFLAAVLPLTFLCYRPGRSQPSARRPVSRLVERLGFAGKEHTPRSTDNPGLLDWALAVLSLAVALYPIVGFDDFLERRQVPTTLDLAVGLVLLALVLEACRRTSGWWLPAICLGFLAYAYYGGYLPLDWSLAHVGFNVDEIVPQLYMGTSGFYGTPLNVAATYIVLFTIYGAVLDMSGAGKFFIDLSFAAFQRRGRQSPSAPGRTVTLAGFLLGTVSGSGTATAVSLGSVAWPILRRAGYPRERAGGVLAAAGIGAILSPPTLGAAAFIIAELLRTSYLTVLIYAIVPTILYYVGVILAIEIDARKHGTRGVEIPHQSALRLLLRFGYHFLSLFLIVAFMAADIPPFRAVVYATILQFLFSFLDPAHRMTPRRLVQALATGTRSVLPVATVCASAGIIVAVVTLTGLGLNLAGIIVDGASAITQDPTLILVLTAVFAAVAVTVLGLAVPVTASFIIAAVIITPALVELGVSRPEAYMFVFYYAVLSEVSPPTALAALAAAAITGGNPLRTMWACWSYALPAFLVPFAFVLSENGAFLLAQGPILGVVWATAVSVVAVAALAAAAGGWIVGPAHPVERVLAFVAALLLLYLEPITIGLGGALVVLAVAIHLLRRRLVRPALDSRGGP